MDKQNIKLDEMQEFMAELEWYKTVCKEDGLPGYYDCFKTHKTENDLNANKNRLKLAAFWDRIFELVEKEELPKDLQTQDKWINAGTEYRLLVEPLDIAQYYRLGKDEDSGSYLANGRPRRYKLLQKWLDGKKRKGRTESRARTQPPFLTQDSCFWAYVEDAHYFSTDEELKPFQTQLENMMDRLEISLDVFSPNSTFMNCLNSFKMDPSEQDLLSFYNKLKSYARGLII